MTVTVRPRRAEPAVPPRKLSVELADLHALAGERAITLREVIHTLRGRAYLLLVVLLTLPFLQPVPLPGLSTPLGLAIALIALRLALGLRPWLPKKIQRTQLPPGFFGKLLFYTQKLVRLIESALRPRWRVITGARWLRQLHAAIICVCAAVLLLPLVIPFSNTLPGWTIFLLACGLMQRDGLAILLGYVMFAVTVVYFVFLGEITTQLVDALLAWWRS